MINKTKVCSSCNERNNPTFSQCWQCGFSLSSAELIPCPEDPAEKALLKAWELLRKTSRTVAKISGQGLDTIGNAAKQICISNGVSEADAEIIAKNIKIASAVAVTAAGCAVAAPILISALGASAGAGAVTVTHGLATLGGGALATGGGGMATGIAMTSGASAVAAGAAGVAAYKREEKKAP